MCKTCLFSWKTFNELKSQGHVYFYWFEITPMFLTGPVFLSLLPGVLFLPLCSEEKCVNPQQGKVVSEA